MNLNTLTITTLVRQQAAAIQAKTTALLSFVVGSIELARAEAVAAIAVWLQSLVMQLLSATRLSTSTGTDIDTFVGDFGLIREPAVAATGQVAFSRFTPTNQALVAVGSTIQTADGSQSFTVIADTTQAAWNAALNAYVIPAGTASAIATVQAVNAGIQGNVNANTITTISTAISGVDTVTNANAFSSGVDQETDPALIARFQLYIQGLKQGIASSVASAISGLQQGIQYTLVENQDYSGATDNGYFYVVISPGTSGLQSLVYAAIDAIRPLTSRFGVFAATQLTANVSATVTAASGYTHTQVAAAVTTAIQDFIATIQLGQTLYYTQLYAVIWAVPGVQDVSALLLNSGSADLAATAQEAIVAGTVAIS